MFPTSPYVATRVLRFGLALVFIWFGAQQLADASGWVTYVPDWMVNIGLKPETVIIVNGIFEVVTAFLLITGVSLKPISWLLALHMILIATEAGGAIAVRDFGLAVGCVALALSAPDPWTVDAGLQGRRQHSSE